MTCNCNVCTSIIPSRYISPTYHHGVFEGLPRSSVCECGYWSCITRGCGACPDCEGEHCECNQPEFPMGEFPTGREYSEPEEDFFVRGVDTQSYPPEGSLSDAYPTYPVVDTHITCACGQQWHWVQTTGENCPECGRLDTPF